MAGLLKTAYFLRNCFTSSSACWSRVNHMPIFSKALNGMRFTERPLSSSFRLYSSASSDKEPTAGNKAASTPSKTTGDLGDESFSPKTAFNLKIVNADAPRAALLIGSLGVLPAIVPPLICFAMQTYYPFLADAQVAYGASLLAFLGGTRWGLAMPPNSVVEQNAVLLWSSTVPLVAAFISLLLPMPYNIVSIVLSMFLVWFTNARRLPYPRWMKVLGLYFTLITAFSMYCTIVAYRALADPLSDFDVLMEDA